MFTSFTSTKKQKILKGYKKYFLSTHKRPSDPYLPKEFRESQERRNVKKRILKNTNKFSKDLSKFG